MDRLISRFTPSLTSAETLEAMLVQRQDLAETIVERIRDSVTSQAKHHTLLVGPRGIGKTHLVALTYHRVKALAELQEDIRIAWLHEEEWGVASFLDLLLRILRALHEEYRDLDLAEQVEALYDLESPEEAQVEAETLLRTYVGDRTLLVLAENLDDIFQGLRNEGQQQFRAYLQQYPFTTLLATSQSLFEGVSKRSFPFYGFFRTHHLEAFSLDEAAELLANIAEHEEKDDLAEFIRTPEGRARIRAVHHLAGGNPRVYVILSQFLTRESLDALVEPFMLMLDDLTPYYQARMAWLSAQQRKIVEVLIEHRAALPVKQIANRCFITPQTASGQLKVLRELGYVHSEQHGRESYYELREPLMRFSLEVKKHRARPIRLFVDFLRIWYTRPELEHQLDLLGPDAQLDREYLLQALTASTEDSNDPRITACLQDFGHHIESEQYDLALTAADDLVGIRGDAKDYARRVVCLVGLKRFEDALRDVDHALDLEPGDSRLLIGRIGVLVGAGRVDEATAEAERIRRLAPDDTQVLFLLGLLQSTVGQFAQARQTLETATNSGLDEPHAWALLAHAQAWSGYYEDAHSILKLHVDEEALHEAFVAFALRARAFTLIGTGHYAEGLDILDAPPLNASNDGAVRYRRALATLMVSERENEWETLTDLYEQDVPRIIPFASLLASIGAWDDAVRLLETPIDRELLSQEEPHDEEDESLMVMASLLAALLTSAPVDFFPDRIRSLVDVSERIGRLMELGIAFVSSLDQWTALESGRLEHWRNAWVEATSGYDSFAPALRMLGVVVVFRKSKDRRALLELPVEERKLVEQALGLEEAGENG